MLRRALEVYYDNPAPKRKFGLYFIFASQISSLAGWTKAFSMLSLVVGTFLLLLLKSSSFAQLRETKHNTINDFCATDEKKIHDTEYLW